MVFVYMQTGSNTAKQMDTGGDRQEAVKLKTLIGNIKSYQFFHPQSDPFVGVLLLCNHFGRKCL